MPIEGTLREFGIHDVFQLLDMSRKTGVLRVRSQIRTDEGQVYFSDGRVVHARLGELGQPDVAAISDREAQRRAKQQIRTTVFDLMSWRDGSFLFEERPLTDLPDHARAEVPTESLLMEGARRIDEWSRIAAKVPNLSLVPSLAEVPDHETQLDLLPHEWEVLTLIDGERDLKSIAAALERDDFELAKIAYGLVTTGVIELRGVSRTSGGVASATASVARDARASLDAGYEAVKRGDFAAARANWGRFLALTPTAAEASGIRAAVEALAVLQKTLEARDNG